MTISHIQNAVKFKQTVLVIDNQKTVLDTHTAILKSLKLDLNIIALTEPSQAIDWVITRPVDLIVTGLNLTQMSGIQLLNSVKRSNSDKPVPIIVISIQKDINVRREIFAAGAAAYLTKPAKTNELSDVAYFLLHKRKKLFKSSEINDDLKKCS